MTYLELINHFWQKDLEFFFSADEVNLYFRLLNHANRLRWTTPRFNLAVDRLMLEVGIKTKRPFDSARKTLRDAGLIEFVNGNGRGCTTEYHLIGAETSAERDAKNDPLSAHLSDTLSATIPQSLRNENVLHNRSKIKMKIKEANASSDGRKKPASTSTPASPPPDPAPEPWAAWLAEHAPDVQRMKEPLTAAQWASLVADYGLPLVQEVLQAMHNTAGAEKKYKSANLTARTWCKRRCPNGAPPKPAPAPSQPVETVSPVNPEAIAEKSTRAAADLAARQAAFHARQTQSVAAS